MTDLKTSDRCVLCLDQKRSPVGIQCGHSFCRECLEVYKTYQKYAWANKCPICRCKLKEKNQTLKRKYSAANMVPESSAENSENHQIESLDQIFTLEEFMAWASDSTSSETQNSNYNQYVDEHDDLANNDDLDDESEMTELVNSSDDEYDYNDDYFDDDYYELDNDEDYVNFSTDSEYYGHDYFELDDSSHATEPYQQYVEANHMAETPIPITQQQYQQQQQQQCLLTDYNNNINNTSHLFNNPDWEEAIANEIIIIE